MVIAKTILMKQCIDEMENYLIHLTGCVRGELSPCSLCTGCQLEDVSCGGCSCFMPKAFSIEVKDNAAR